MQQPTTEERLARLEKDVAKLKLQRAIQETRDIALLARIDTFIEDLHRVERTQLRGFEELKAEQQEIKAELQEMRADQKTAFATAADTIRDHKQAIEAIAAGQQQILSLLRGNLPRND